MNSQRNHSCFIIWFLLNSGKPQLLNKRPSNRLKDLQNRPFMFKVSTPFTKYFHFEFLIFGFSMSPECLNISYRMSFCSRKDENWLLMILLMTLTVDGFNITIIYRKFKNTCFVNLTTSQFFGLSLHKSVLYIFKRKDVKQEILFFHDVVSRHKLQNKGSSVPRIWTLIDFWTLRNVAFKEMHSFRMFWFYFIGSEIRVEKSS